MLSSLACVISPLRSTAQKATGIHKTFIFSASDLSYSRHTGPEVRAHPTQPQPVTATAMSALLEEARSTYLLLVPPLSVNPMFVHQLRYSPGPMALRSVTLLYKTLDIRAHGPSEGSGEETPLLPAVNKEYALKQRNQFWKHRILSQVPAPQCDLWAHRETLAFRLQII